MKAKVAGLLLAFTLVMSTTGSECVNSPIVVTVNLGAITGCFPVVPLDTMWNAKSDTMVVRDLIDDNFEDGLLRFRLYNIRMRLTSNFPDGPVSGCVLFGFDSPNATDSLFTFSGQSSDFENEGLSLLDPGNIIHLQQAGLTKFIGALNNIQLLPRTVILESTGTCPSAFVLSQFCVDVYVQADAEIN